MKFYTWFALAAVVLALGAFYGCNNDSSDSSGSGTQLVNQTVSIGPGADYQTGVLTALGAGTMAAHVASVGGADMQSWFINVADASVHDQKLGPDVNLAVGTATGQTWKVAVHNTNGVVVNTQVTVNFVP